MKLKVTISNEIWVFGVLTLMLPSCLSQENIEDTFRIKLAKSEIRELPITTQSRPYVTCLRWKLTDRYTETSDYVSYLFPKIYISNAFDIPLDSFKNVTNEEIHSFFFKQTFDLSGSKQARGIPSDTIDIIIQERITNGNLAKVNYDSLHIFYLERDTTNRWLIYQVENFRNGATW